MIGKEYRKKRLSIVQRILRYFFMPILIYMIIEVHKSAKEKRIDAMNRMFNNVNHGTGLS